MKKLIFLVMGILGCMSLSSCLIEVDEIDDDIRYHFKKTERMDGRETTSDEVEQGGEMIKEAPNA